MECANRSDHNTFKSRLSFQFQNEMSDEEGNVSDPSPSASSAPAASSSHANKDEGKRKVKIPRSLPCKSCDKRFSCASLLERHLQSHQENAKYNCSQCGAKFKHDTTLRAHMRKKHRPRTVTYICAFCSKSMSEYSVMRVHLVKVHQMDKEKAAKEARNMSFEVVSEAQLKKTGKLFIFEGNM